MEVKDVEWGYAIVRRSPDTIEDGAARYMLGSESEALRNAILRVIEKAGGKGVAYSEGIFSRRKTRRNRRLVGKKMHDDSPKRAVVVTTSEPFTTSIYMMITSGIDMKKGISS